MSSTQNTKQVLVTFGMSRAKRVKGKIVVTTRQWTEIVWSHEIAKIAKVNGWTIVECAK